MPDTVNDNRFVKFKCSEFIKNIICTNILNYNLCHYSLTTFSMNVSNMVMIHYSDTAEYHHRSINLEFLPTNNSYYNVEHIIHCDLFL